MTKQTRVAVVTGANRGIGLEVARQLAQQGLAVIGTCRNQAEGELAQKKLREAGLTVDFRLLDVTDRPAVQALAKDVLTHQGGADVLVNNAGVLLDSWRSTLELDPDLVRQTMEVNFIGALNCCQAFIPAMLENQSGRVVNLSSGMGSLQDMGKYLLAYRASKTALNALTRCLAAELKDTPDLLINSVCPGWVRTELGGENASRSVAEGADSVVWLATLPPGGPSGGFFRDRKPLPW